MKQLHSVTLSWKPYKLGGLKGVKFTVDDVPKSQIPSAKRALRKKAIHEGIFTTPHKITVTAQ